MVSKHASARKLFAYALEEGQGQNLGCSVGEMRIHGPSWLLLCPPAPPVIWSWVLWFAVVAWAMGPSPAMPLVLLGPWSFLFQKWLVSWGPVPLTTRSEKWEKKEKSISASFLTPLFLTGTWATCGKAEFEAIACFQTDDDDDYYHYHHRQLFVVWHSLTFLKRDCYAQRFLVPPFFYTWKWN